MSDQTQHRTVVEATPEPIRALISELVSAVTRSRRGMDALMPGIGGLVIQADEIANINSAFIECDRVLAKAKGMGLVK